MGKVMNNTQFANIARDIATKYKTLYVMGCFGAPMNSTNKTRYINHHSYNAQSSRASKIRNASADTFGFDCVCLIKGILWGWSGNTGKIYGGASYASNGVPDVGADGIMKYCTGVSTNFSNIQVGELVHMSGHVGIYIGNGLAVECTPIWKDGVQITAVGNIGKKSGYNTRTWVNHGKLNYVEYSQNTPSTPTTDPFPNVSDEELARRVWTGEFGNGDARKQALGSRYNAVQALVDKGVGRNSTPAPAPNTKLSLDEIAKKVINGDYGNYPERKTKLEAEGYNYSEVQNRVNEILNSSNKEASNSSITYTVQRGDTLSGIAKKYGTTWQDIYNKNKSLIDSDAQRHGVRANYYNFIYAGQVLKIK